MRWLWRLCCRVRGHSWTRQTGIAIWWYRWVEFERPWQGTCFPVTLAVCGTCGRRTLPSQINFPVGMGVQVTDVLLLDHEWEPIPMRYTGSFLPVETAPGELPSA